MTGSNVQRVGMLRNETIVLGSMTKSGGNRGSDYLRWDGDENHWKRRGLITERPWFGKDYLYRY